MENPTLVPLGEDYPEIREGVRAVCEGFPGKYWRDLEDREAYPDEFVRGLTDGQATDVLVTLNALRTAGGGSILDEAWFWALIGGVVLVGGGVAAYFIADDAAQLRPNQPLVIRY